MKLSQILQVVYAKRFLKRMHIYAYLPREQMLLWNSNELNFEAKGQISNRALTQSMFPTVTNLDIEDADHFYKIDFGWYCYWVLPNDPDDAWMLDDVNALVDLVQLSDGVYIIVNPHLATNDCGIYSPLPYWRIQYKIIGE